jgi:hypothetical protein
VFRVVCFPVPAANPAVNKAGHLYVAYADKAQNADPNDRADVFLVCSTDGGVNWTAPQRVSTIPNNDQWMPVLCVKPDGKKLFVAWYDRRNDPNNSLIDVYGRWGTIAANGHVSFGGARTEFKISTANFPPVFVGTLAENVAEGHYDPVYPPGNVNLNWWYPDWPLINSLGFPDFTLPTYVGHVGEYNAAWSETSAVYFTWTDYRLTASSTRYPRHQSDIRFLRLPWP